MTAYRITTPVPHSVCASTAYCFRDSTTPPTSTPSPATKPIAIRTSGGIRLLSNEYLTKKATARNAASPPTQASSFTPMNCSQLMADTSGRTDSRAGCGCGLMLGTGGGAAAGGTGLMMGGVTRVGVIAAGAGCRGCGVAVKEAAGALTGSPEVLAAAIGPSGAADTAFGACSFSRFSRNTSPSSAARRRRSSSMLSLAPTARATSHTARAMTPPITSNRISMAPSINLSCAHHTLPGVRSPN